MLAGAQSSAQVAFDRGRLAFERQDYASALQEFEAALAQGMQGPAVHFNVGVAAYRAQQYDKARTAFEEVARTPSMAGVARYNLGLVALAQNDTTRAIDAFALAYEQGTDDRVRVLALTQLERIGTKPASDTTWAGYASSGVGYDDNVTLTANSQALGVARESDAYGEMILVGTWQLASAWRLEADASMLKYADLDAYDQWGVGAGARYRFAWQPWTFDAGAQVGTTYLDGERFDVRESAYVQAQRALANDRSLRARYRLSNVEASDEYPGLDGLRHEWMARVVQRRATWTAGLAYVFELSDYESAALSAMRHQLSADVRVPWSRWWATRALLAYRYSDYDDTAMGAEQRVEVGAVAELALTERWSLALQYLFTDNDADAAEYTYRRNRMFLGVEGTF